MIGQSLSAYPPIFEKVSARHRMKPHHSIHDRYRRIHVHDAELCARRDDFDFDTHYHELPLSLLSVFTTVELCKLSYAKSSTYTAVHRSITEHLANMPAGSLFFKIQSSFWKWGCSKGTWNEMVDAYNALRTFALNLGPDFSVVLDYTTARNERGYSTYSRTFLDGTFGYMVTYKGKQVMTIGFSVCSGKKLLIQQVQLKEAHGNRWLYQLKMHRTQFVVKAMQQHFVGYRIYLVEGKSAYRKLYREQVELYRQTVSQLSRHRRFTAEAENEKDRTYHAKQIAECTRHSATIAMHLQSLRIRRTGILTCYTSTAVQDGTDVLECNLLSHYLVA